MQELIDKIQEIKNSEIERIIQKRKKQFEKVKVLGENSIFNELCFCFMTANFSAQGSIKIQDAIGEGFSNYDEEKLSSELARLGHRFPNVRAKYIILARRKKKELIQNLNKISEEFVLREWIVKNIKGLGMKESSHFLRNIGYKNLAIIDFHIIHLLVKNKLIEKPKTKSLTPKKYLEIENTLRQISEKTNLKLGELDLYLWYLETGKILK